MAGTTIRVDVRTHEMLRELLKQEHKPIGHLVTDLVARRREERFWQDLETSLDRLRADPVAWREYQDEIALWDTTSGDGLENEVAYVEDEEDPDA